MLRLNLTPALRPVSIALVTFLTTACVAPHVKMYEGSDLIKNEAVAVIKSNEALVGIVSVDGRSTMGFFELWGRNMIDGTATRKETKHARSVEVAPGKRTLAVQYDGYGVYARGHLWLLAEAGQTYTLNSVLGDRTVRFWIVDNATGRRVGGIEGSDDEPKN